MKKFWVSVGIAFLLVTGIAGGSTGGTVVQPMEHGFGT